MCIVMRSGNPIQWDKLQTPRYTHAKFKVDPCNIDRDIAEDSLVRV
jgi:hypothetical protein